MTETPAARYQPADVRRRQILDAAARLATREGLEDTSIAKVATEAGVAKGAIYLHFSSRRELIAALQSEVWAQMMEPPRAMLGDEALSWAERLDGVVAHWMRFELEHQQLYHAVFHTVITDDDEPMSEASGLLSRLLAGGVQAGEFALDGLDADTVVQFLLHAYVGPCFHNADPAGAVADVQRLFRRVVGAGKPAALAPSA